MTPHSHPDKTPPGDYVPWTPPGAPPATRLQDAVRPLVLIGIGAVVVALLVAWLSSRNQEPMEAPLSLAGGGVERGVGLPASLLVDSEPVGATVWVNGDSVGVTPTWLSEVEPGVVEVVLHADAISHDTTLALRPGQDGSILIWLENELLAEEPRLLTQDIQNRPDPTGAIGEDDSPDPDPASETTAPPTGESRPAVQEAPETGRLQITTVPEGASVWVARERVGQTPLDLEAVPAGEQIVEIRAAGYEPERLRLDIAPDVVTSQAITLRARPGIVTVMADPGSRVFVDGELQGTVESDPLRLPLIAGRHEVRVFHPSKGEEFKVIQVVAGTSLRLTFDSPSATAQSEDPPARGSETPRRRTGW